MEVLTLLVADFTEVFWKEIKVNAKSELQVKCDIPFPYTHSEVSGYQH
jgi:hypothetical protein